MEYSINKLAKLAGISTRALRYYDEIELLSPKRVSGNGYRVYGRVEVDLLQQILLYRELEVPLEEIKRIIHAKSYDGTSALKEHLSALKAKRERVELLIANVEKTLAAVTGKGEITMTDKEKFEGFKKNLIDENEAMYGKEIRERYGADVIDGSNAKLMGLSPEQYDEAQALSKEINEKLKSAFRQGDPSGEAAQEVCELHKKWLLYFWSSYSKQAHLGLAQTYVDDPRFRKYYDDIEEGCAVFLRDSLQVYCQ